MGENIDKSQEEDGNDMVEINSFHISSEQAIREDHMAVMRSFEVKKSHERYHMTKDDG